MNFLVILTIAILSAIVLTSLLTTEEWTTDGINTYFSHQFTLPDGAKAGISKFDDCIKFAVNSKEWSVEKLTYDGSLGAAETVYAEGTLGIWRIHAPVGEFSIVIRKRDESCPYFLNVRRDLTGTWDTSVSRF